MCVDDNDDGDDDDDVKDAVRGEGSVGSTRFVWDVLEEEDEG